jgi:serine/threonine-protein kinase
MSPEQARGELDRLGPRSDVYSLGATLYYLLTGRPPLEGDDIGSVLRVVQTGGFLPPRKLDPAIDKGIEAVCLKAMALEPGDRYPSARALADDVERWIADEPVSARREPASARIARWARRHRSAVAALGLSLGLAVVLLSVSNVRVSHAQHETAQALARVKEEQGRTMDALQRADTNFRRARQAVEDYFTTVSEEVLLDEPGMEVEGLREKLLCSALKYHEMFLAERAGDPSVEAEVADSHRRYANIGMYTSRREDPLPHLRIARERFENLVLLHPDRPEYRQQLARTLFDIGEVLPKSQREESLRLDRAAVALCDQLLRERPEDEVILDDLARTLVSMGKRLYELRGRSGEGILHMRRAREILQRLIAREPDSLQARLKLAALHCAMYSLVAGDQRRQDEALQASHDALSVFRELLTRAPQSPRFKQQIGLIHDNRGILYARQKRWADALQEGRQARSTLSQVVAANPDNDQYRRYLAGACMRLGEWMNFTGVTEQALDPLREACDQFESIVKNRPGDTSSRPEYSATLTNLGATLGLLGRYDESASALERAIQVITQFSRDDPNNIFLRGDLISAKFNLAVFLTRAGRHREALTAYEESRSIGKELFGEGGWSHGDSIESPGNIAMAYSLRELGRDREAEQALALGRKALNGNAAGFHELACYEARGAQRLRSAGGHPRAIAALEHSALERLRRAVELGFAEKVSLRRFGAAYQLRDCQEYQLILLDSAFPAEPFSSDP